MSLNLKFNKIKTKISIRTPSQPYLKDYDQSYRKVVL